MVSLPFFLVGTHTLHPNIFQILSSAACMWAVEDTDIRVKDLLHLFRINSPKGTGKIGLTKYMSLNNIVDIALKVFDFTTYSTKKKKGWESFFYDISIN